MEKTFARQLDKSRLDCVVKTLKRRTGIPFSPQDILDMFHDIDIALGHAEEGTLPDHWVVEHFWDLVEEIGLDKLDHSPKPDMVAINLREFREACWERVLPEPSFRMLTHYLPTSSTRYTWIGPHRNVMSKLTGQVKRCWVFHKN
ncbi:MAG: hypothetical protein KUA35_09190 [Pseudodesulfovibrio sp.]|uniref:hypothetical protein n=1 Tax=Pseudodesulfovibrio TaxID=2035811 RepID=UPI0001BFA842|nr:MULTISPECIES: hypothetical protein [Pseudodesulfovibrio]MBU4475244.1 hypothetical protein [Pseudomonadota bacterium]MBU4516283.1 hypothetical protein [Pseudomonadota bacterium]MBU4522462.1 hypothetical protein [Pseudomonadota bacterium]MBU4558664.1 hypothetical protein [Pseudomonadota bacterium]MBV1764231.1 hypothetical protein [Pseudodesulfovibrio sp.]